MKKKTIAIGVALRTFYNEHLFLLFLFCLFTRIFRVRHFFRVFLSSFSQYAFKLHITAIEYIDEFSNKP